MKMARMMILAGLAMWAAGSFHAGEDPVNAALERERLHDEKMWQLMRVMLVEFGYSNKVAALDVAWQKTMTPKQWATIDWSQRKPPELTPGAQQIAMRCAAVTNADFTAVFRLACREAPDVQNLVTGLLAWTQKGGRPLLQGRHDLALHFIYAAVCELGGGLGVAVSVIKEQFDQSRGKPFDLDDLAAGVAGAEWVRQARLNPGWLRMWASGVKDLDHNLPVLRYGVRAHSPELLLRIQQDVQAAFVRNREGVSQ